jgi:hypothetical protein
MGRLARDATAQRSDAKAQARDSRARETRQNRFQDAGFEKRELLAPRSRSRDDQQRVADDLRRHRMAGDVVADDLFPALG